jgi:hypothetical protein
MARILYAGTSTFPTLTGGSSILAVASFEPSFLTSGVSLSPFCWAKEQIARKKITATIKKSFIIAPAFNIKDDPNLEFGIWIFQLPVPLSSNFQISDNDPNLESGIFNHSNLEFGIWNLELPVPN